MKKIIFLLFFFALNICVYGQQPDKSLAKGDKYTTIDGVLYITDYKDDPIRLVRVPVNYDKITYVIPETVKYISSKAFKGCKYVRRVIVSKGCNLEMVADDAFDESSIEFFDIEEEKNEQASTSNNVVYEDVEQMPSFPGGLYALMDYLQNNVKYPKQAQANGIEGRVIVSFIVETNGTISDIKVVQPVNPLLDEEAARVIRSMPRWIPGKMKNGEPIRVSYNVPVNFSLH